jgi:hypothetical protein
MKNPKKNDATEAGMEPATAPNPGAPLVERRAMDATIDDTPAEVPQTLPYPGKMVKFVSRDQFIAAAHSGEADFSPAMIARVLPTKGPDDNPLRVDLMVIDPEREGGSYVERSVVPFDGTGPGYYPLNQPIAVSFGVDSLRPIIALLMEEYMDQRQADEKRYDEESIKELVSQEVKRVIEAQSKPAKDKDK